MSKFDELLQEMAALHAKKQEDYGAEGDPFANIRASEEWGIDGWVGAMVRLSDKVHRLKQLAKRGSLSNESAIDSFMDIAVYALIARILYEEGNEASDYLDSWGKKAAPEYGVEPAPSSGHPPSQKDKPGHYDYRLRRVQPGDPEFGHVTYVSEKRDPKTGDWTPE